MRVVPGSIRGSVRGSIRGLVGRSVAAIAVFSLLGLGAAQLGLAQSPVPVSTTKEATLSTSAPKPTSVLPPQIIAPPAEIAKDAPVVTLKGLCDAPATGTKKTGANPPAAKASAKTCKTVITRAQLDALINLLIPDAPAEQRHQFALNYIRVFAASKVATQKNIESDPEVAKEMAARLELTRQQVMAGSLYSRVEKLSQDVQETEIQSYVSNHQDAFTKGELQRISLSKAPKNGTPPELAALKAKAEELHDRAVKGEDFDALQKEASSAAGATTPTPPTKMSVVRAGLAKEIAAVFDLKPGEVAPVIDGPSSFEILKLVSVSPVPVDSVRAQLKTALINGHLQLLMKDATRGVTADFNLPYLGLTSAPELFPMPSLRQPGRGGAPDPRTASGRPGSQDTAQGSEIVVKAPAAGVPDKAQQ